MTRIRSAMALVFTLLAVSASAQIGQGTLTGVVTDPQGAVLPRGHGDGDLTRVDRQSHDDDGSRRPLPAPAASLRRLQAEIRPLGIHDDRAREHPGRARTDDHRRHTAEGRVARRNRHGHGGITGRGRDDDEGGHQPQGRRVDRHPELHRCVGRAFRSARRPDAGVRRRRQSQEPAVGLRGVRRAEPGDASSPKASITPRASAARASTRTTSRTRSTRSARSAATWR